MASSTPHTLAARSLQLMLTDRMMWCFFNTSLDPGQWRAVKRTGQSRCSGVLFEHFASSAGSEHHGIDGSGAHLRGSMRPTRTSVHSAPVMPGPAASQGIRLHRDCLARGHEVNGAAATRRLHSWQPTSAPTTGRRDCADRAAGGRAERCTSRLTSTLTEVSRA